MWETVVVVGVFFWLGASSRSSRNFNRGGRPRLNRRNQSESIPKRKKNGLMIPALTTTLTLLSNPQSTPPRRNLA
jgi:hypothetical protein